MTPNLSVNRTACKLRLQVPSALRAPAAGYLNVEAVDKPVFKWKSDKRVAQKWSAPFFIFMPFSRSTGKVNDFSLPGGLVRSASGHSCFPLLSIPVVRQFLDVVPQTVELPLRIDFLLSAQREAIQPLVVPQVAEHRFDGGEALAVAGLAFSAVDGLLHPVAVTFRCAVGFAPEEADLPDPGPLRGAQAFVPLLAGQAVTLATGLLGRDVTVVDTVAAIPVELLARRAGADAGFRIKAEIPGAVADGGLLRVGLVVERVGFRFVFALILEALVALAHAVVGDQRRDVLCRQRLQVGFGVVTLSSMPGG